MAAMFKAQTDVWEETQEKMSQSVSGLSSIIPVRLNNNEIFILVCHLFTLSISVLVYQCHPRIQQHSWYWERRQTLYTQADVPTIRTPLAPELRLL